MTLDEMQPGDIGVFNHPSQKKLLVMKTHHGQNEISLVILAPNIWAGKFVNDISFENIKHLELLAYNAIATRTTFNEIV